MEKSKFALVLKQCRKNAGLTQQQIASVLNVERSTYAYYEVGKTSPSCSFVLKIAKILNVDYKIFIEAIADTSFDNNDEDKNYTTLTSDSWKTREKMYTLSEKEQNVILSYRVMPQSKRSMIDSICSSHFEEKKDGDKKL